MTTNIRTILLRSALGAAAIALVAAVPAASLAQEEPTGIESLASSDDPPAFDTPEAAVEAFKGALAADDFDGLARLLGLDAAKLRTAEGVMDTYAKIREGAARQVTIENLGDRKILDIGAKLWPLPFPLVKDGDGKWYFDTFEGLEEVVNRRVGENELEAVATLRGIMEAEDDYASADHDGDGVLEYAQKLISSDGTTDGLYWPSGQGEGDSPVGDLINQAELDDARKGEGYFGYRFKVLKGQGDNIAGGAQDYVVNGNMTAGFGVLAWPVTYAETGVHTFIASHHGAVYEIDLGPATADIVKYIDRFNPDESWTVVND
jgi:hypothetical protein